MQSRAIYLKVLILVIPVFLVTGSLSIFDTWECGGSFSYNGHTNETQVFIALSNFSYSPERADVNSIKFHPRCENRFASSVKDNFDAVRWALAVIKPLTDGNVTVNVSYRTVSTEDRYGIDPAKTDKNNMVELTSCIERSMAEVFLSLGLRGGRGEAGCFAKIRTVAGITMYVMIELIIIILIICIGFAYVYRHRIMKNLKNR